MLRPFNYSIALLFYLLKASKFLIGMSHICAICTIHLDTLLTLLKNKKRRFYRRGATKCHTWKATVAK